MRGFAIKKENRRMDSAKDQEKKKRNSLTLMEEKLEDLLSNKVPSAPKLIEKHKKMSMKC